MFQISFAVFYILNESALSKKSSHHGQLSCPSLQCLLLPSNVSLPATEQETIPSREINTWYPIPKWRVFFDPKRSRNGYSQPYFNKQETRKTDGYIFENDFFYHQKDFFERLNIKFLPLQDGYIAVKGFEGKINDSEEEYVALFVVYVHWTRKNSSESIKITEKEWLSEKENENVTCDRPDGCNFSISASFFNSSTPKNFSLSKYEKIASIPIFSNMSIEMKIGNSDENNYTVFIMPFDRFLNSTETENGEMQPKTINVTLSRNMSMIIKSSEIIPLNKSAENNFENINERDTLNTNSPITDNILLLNNSDVNLNLGINDSVKNASDESPVNYLKTTESNLNSSLYDSENTELYEDKYFEHKNYTLKEKQNINYILNDENSNLNTNLSETYDHRSKDILNEKRLQKDYSTESIHKENKYKLSNETNNKVDLNKHDYIRLLESYELKAVNTTKLPFIATLQITINYKDNRNKTNLMFHIESKKENKSSTLEENINDGIFTKSKDVFQRVTKIKKRNTKKEYFAMWQDLYTKPSISKDVLINDEYIFREKEFNNKLSKSPNKIVLNETEGMSQALKTTNYFPLILPKQATELRNSSSELLSNLKRSDSYSPATISRVNEEFNKKNTYKSRNKGLIQNQILENPDGADSAKSNHMAYANRNKREITLPTLIQNKDSRENHSRLKKSELQIVERGSFARHLSRWKRKISPGVMRLLRNDIKMSKICELGDVCDRINDVFSGMGESKYQRLHEEKWVKFDSKGNMKVDRMYNHSFKKNKNNMPLLSKNIKNNNSKNVQITENLNNALYLHSNNKYTPNTLDTFTVLNKKIPLNFRYNMSFNLILKKQNASKINQSYNYKNGRNFGSDNDVNRNNFRDNHGTKINGNARDNSLKSEILTRQNREISNFFSNYEKSPRKRRSNTVFIPILNAMNPSQFLNPRMIPNQIYSQGINVQIKNISSVMPINASDFQRQKTFQTTKVSGEDFKNFNAARSISEKDEKNFKRLTQGNDSPIVWYPNIQGNERLFTNNFATEYKWVIIIPEDNHDFKKFMRSKSVNQPSNSENKNSKHHHTNTDREREDNDWEHNEWMLIDPVTYNPEDKYVYTEKPEMQQKPWDIINLPTKNPFYPPTNEPGRKPVLRTTKEPLRKPTSYNPRKAARYPYHRTTFKPWSPGMHWESNEWTISHNPWHNRPTTPMMMMGNMAGGD